MNVPTLAESQKEGTKGTFFVRHGDAASPSMKHKLFKSTQQLFAGAKGQEGKKYHIQVQWKFRKFERIAKTGKQPGC